MFFNDFHAFSCIFRRCRRLRDPPLLREARDQPVCGDPVGLEHEIQGPARLFCWISMDVHAFFIDFPLFTLKKIISDASGFSWAA